MIRSTYIWQALPVIFLLTLAPIVNADLVISFSPGAGGAVNASFSGGTGLWVGDTAVFHLFEGDNVLTFPGGFISDDSGASLSFGGQTNLTSTTDQTGYTNTLMQVTFAGAIPNGTALSGLNGKSVLLAGWDISHFNIGTHNVFGGSGLAGHGVTVNVSAVPEPSSLVLFSCFAPYFLRRRRRC